ncbi:hypothetical protein CBL_07763 [Carabus blaptoides fortunei]
MDDSINAEAVYSFNEHCMLATVFCELLNVRERTIALAWIAKLKAIPGTNQFKLKLEYINYMLYCMSKNCMVYPFNRVPFDRVLKPLQEVVPKEQYITHIIAERKEDTNRVSQTEPRTPDTPVVPPMWPGEFITSNPIPNSGVMCYMAAFGE